MRLFVWILCSASLLPAHDIITTAVTFNREISRILLNRCASCHRTGGIAFPLLTYAQTRPWAVAIKEETLRRRMPPWGAVKGFGEFRNDQSLSAEEIEVLLSWIDGGVPEGQPKDLPPIPKFPKPAKFSPRGMTISGSSFTLPRPIQLDGMQLKSVPASASFKLTAEFPDGRVEPLLWLDAYREEFVHPFLFRKLLYLPAGSIIRGLPAGVSVVLLNGVPQP